MKRSDALASLSRDHHRALEVALRLRRADPDSVDEAVGRLRAFLADHGERHFELEERVILPALPADDDEWAPAVERMLDEHRTIREEAAHLSEAPDLVEAAHRLGQCLHDHVRYEERTVFPILERRLDSQELKRLAVELREPGGAP